MKKIKINYPWEKDSSRKLCDQYNCKNFAEFQAPKSTNSDEKYNFCLEHVKLYNKRWNFFAGKSQEEIYCYLKNETYLNKPTRPMSEKIKSKIDFEFVFDFLNEEKKTFNPSNDNNLERALKLFNLKVPFNKKSLKEKYNILVKANHPDLHAGDKGKESLLKKINNYYKILQKIAN
tara:strand:+ start:25997 stop:26524 length:528 start_codon:yes stop_codon:yes gene_type:complete